MKAANELCGSEDDMRPVIRAAEYVRMSTEHQKYSTENQGEAIRAYVSSLLRNEQVVKYLDLHHAEILNEFRRITEVVDDTADGSDEADLPVAEQA